MKVKGESSWFLADFLKTVFTNCFLVLGKSVAERLGALGTPSEIRLSGYKVHTSPYTVFCYLVCLFGWMVLAERKS